MLHLGCEVEFMNMSEDAEVCVDSDHLYEMSSNGLTIHKEYYDHMYEINSFHAIAETVPELVDALYDHMDKVKEALKYHTVHYEHALPIHQGLAFTGIHLHIQDDDHIPDYASESRRTARRMGRSVVSAIARMRGLSLRQIVSHHIWGNYRSTDCSWKESIRFKPVLWNRMHQTYELRCIDFDMLLPEKRRQLTALLSTAFAVAKGERKRVSKWLMDGLLGLPTDITPCNMERYARFFQQCMEHDVELLFDTDGGAERLIKYPKHYQRFTGAIRNHPKGYMFGLSDEHIMETCSASRTLAHALSEAHTHIPASDPISNLIGSLMEGTLRE